VSTPFRIADIWMYRAYCQQGPQVSVNTHFFKVITNGGGFDAQEAIDSITAAARPLYRALIPGGATFLGGEGTNLTIVPTPFKNQSSQPGAGLATGISLPTQVCGIYTKHTEVAGPSGRGRTYVPFPSDDALGAVAGSDIPTAAYQLKVFNLSGNFSGTVAYLTATLIAFQVQWGLYREPPTPAPPVFTPIISTVAHRLWATQKRRGDYGRPNVSPF